MQCIRYIKHGKRPTCIVPVQRQITHDSIIKKSTKGKQPDKVSKIESLYRKAFSETKGRPSAALLNALKQQSRHDGVCVTGQQIQSFEYDEMVFQNKSRNSKIRSIRGSSSTSIGVLNTYLDMYLHKNELKEFLLMLEKTRDVKQSSVDQSIILRYVFKCKKASVSPQIEMTGNIKILASIMGLYFQDMLEQSNAVHEGIDQAFVDEIISTYSFYLSEFEDFKAAMRVIDPQLKFSVIHEKEQQDVLYESYPIIESLCNLSGENLFPYPSNVIDKDAIKTQLKNEKNDFTQVKSISSERNHCQDLWQYKSKVQNEWCNTLYKALLAQSRLYKRGDHKDFRSHNCPILDNDVICLRTVAQETTNYICEELVTQYDGIEVNKIKKNLFDVTQGYIMLSNLFTFCDFQGHSTNFSDFEIVKCHWEYGLQDLLQATPSIC